MRRSSFAITLVVALSLASHAAACLDVSLLRDVLVRAHPDVRVCAAAHDLPGGRYLVHVVVDMTTGKVEEVEVAESPDAVGAPAASCLEAAFTRLQFPATGPHDPRAPLTRSGGGRVSRVPPPASSGLPSIAQIAWPFVLDR